MAGGGIPSPDPQFEIVGEEVNAKVILADGRDISTDIHDIINNPGIPDNQKNYKYINVDKELMQGMTVQVEYKITIENIKDSDDDGDGNIDDEEKKAKGTVNATITKLNYDENCKFFSEDNTTNKDKLWEKNTSESNKAFQDIEIDEKGNQINLTIVTSQLISTGMDPEYEVEFEVVDENGNKTINNFGTCKFLVYPPTGTIKAMFPNILNKMKLSR